MKKHFLLLAGILLLAVHSYGQTPFEYELQITPVTVTNLPGLQSLAVAQHDGKWLLVGGRKDGVHARQPFNTFPVAYNNTSLYVIDVNANMVWSAPLTSLSTSLQEQLQSTNTNFYQDHDTLYIIGGYAFSPTANDFITFDNMTSIDVPGLMNAIINNGTITSYFKQISNPIFKNTGAQMGKIGNKFYLVGGQDFQGQYNPMGNPTYTQTYHAQYTSFTIDNSGNQLSIANLQTTVDAINLRRRDYNLVPQIFPDGSEGYMISSGVFQPNVNLPFLYPVNITATGYQAIPSFNQYLSNYQSAKVALWDSANNRMHNLFFGGISQYYMLNGTLTQDVNVPFTKTISRLTRMPDSSLSEVEMNVSMPEFLGAGSEFFPNQLLPHTESEIIKLSAIAADTFLVGHIYGGIKSPTNNPFTVNQTSTTSTNTTIYKVELIKNKNGNPESVVDGRNPYEFSIYPNPTEDNVQVQFDLKKMVDVNYFITTVDGKLIAKNELQKIQTGANNIKIPLDNTANQQALMLTLVFENKYFVTHKIMIK
jgi:hypothetical protein